MTDWKKIEKVKELAGQIGFSDIRFCSYQNETLFFLFMAYRPAREAEFGKINLSNYYIASQKGYLGMQKLLSLLEKSGIRAQEIKEHGVKQLALQTGGFIGKNSLYYHEQYGSFVSIHVLKINIFCAEKIDLKKKTCEKCGLCEEACPSHAIGSRGFDVSHCVRAYSNERFIPEAYRGFIYQLLGCEKCQLACPHNDGAFGAAHSFDLVELIEGKHIKEIRTLVGANYGRRRIIMGQAILYAANVGYTPALSAIEALTEDEFVGETARFAAKILKKR